MLGLGLGFLKGLMFRKIYAPGPTSQAGFRSFLGIGILRYSSN